MAHSRHRRVAVVGSAQTVLKPRWADRQHVDLISEAVTNALMGTGLRIEDVDFVIDSGSDFLDGRSISNCGFLGAMGAHHKEESRVEEDGLWAAVYGANKIASGSARVGLIVAYSKSSESEPRNYWSSLAEPFSQRPVGLDHHAACGLMAQAYLARAGADLAKVQAMTSRNWELAIANPLLELGDEGHGSSDMDEIVARPLRRMDMARPVDGAVALVLADADVARQVSATPVWVAGMGASSDQHYLAARSLVELPAARAAAQQAFRMAGRNHDEIGMVEISAHSTVGEAQVLEALGFAEAFAGLDSYARDAGPQVNASGGSVPADVVMASGLLRLHEVAAQLSGRSDRNASVPPAGLAHGTGGLGMQNHCVMIVEAS